MKTDTNRVVLITGASSGFGQASAEHLSRRGYRVYGTSRKEKAEDGSERTVDGNLSFRMIPMDIREDASVQKGIEIILSREDRLDVVVNNAGYAVAGSVEDCPLEEVKNQIESIINHPSPRLRYTAGLMSQRMAAIIKRITPGWFMEWAIMKSYNL